MRRLATGMLLVLVIAALSSPAWAGEEQALVNLAGDLEAALDRPGAKWSEHWGAYRAFTKQRAALSSQISSGDKELAKAASAELAEGNAAYAPLQKRTADAVRRTTLPASGWIMAFFGSSLLFGGFAVCIAIAIKDPVKIDDDAA